jgi:hypothetical protein
MTLTIGSTLENRYRIEKKLGQGGFGASLGLYLTHE